MLHFSTLTSWLRGNKEKSVNILDISTRYSTNTIRNSIIDLVFASTNLASKITNWYIDKKANTRSNCKIIRYKITTNKQQIIENSITTLYNIVKADWKNFSAYLNANKTK